MAKKYYWLKLKTDFFSSKAIKKLRRIAGGDTYTVIYLKLQLLSLKDEGLLIYEGVEPTFYEEMALALDEDADNVRAALAFLENMGLIEQKNNSEYLLTEVPYLIGSETDKAELMRKKRAREKIESSNNVTEVLPSVTKRYTEIEIEIEKELEIEKSERKKAKRFTPPTLEEVTAYCIERNNNVDAQHFIDYYTSNGWQVGKNKMKDWKAAIRTWERNGYSNKTNNTNKGADDLDDFYNMAHNWAESGD